jgi:hypothetical protein
MSFPCLFVFSPLRSTTRGCGGRGCVWVLDVLAYYLTRLFLFSLHTKLVMLVNGILLRDSSLLIVG